ncbi:MAG: dienelactone hydrolase family protein [Verrucomicrobiota bacterium]|nr:dienelactone hydrolase family protein [Limisphaera sp.]MDW8382506.1 dienelactone hydrolase family protein [Verrucomicrobiota bacterium]
MKTMVVASVRGRHAQARIQSRLARALGIGTFSAGLWVSIWTAEVAAQDWARARLEQSPRHLEWVKVQRDTRAVQCFVAYPERPKPTAAVIVIHEIFGLTDWVRSVTDQLAEAGYLAVAPDLLSGTAPGGGGTAEWGGPDAARKAVGALPQEQIIGDLEAVIRYVGQLPACNGRVAVAGFCWGGAQAFRLATLSTEPRAFFVFYGTGPDKEEELARIQRPVYGFYAGNDARVNAGLPALRRTMEQLGKTFEVVVYEGAGHGFMRAGEAPDASPENRQARAEAWERWKKRLQTL